jgi:hypothetical protein
VQFQLGCVADVPFSVMTIVTQALVLGLELRVFREQRFMFRGEFFVGHRSPSQTR